jgi:hypothetical protein
MGLKRIKDTEAARAKKDRHAKLKTVEERLQVLERAAGLK